MKKKLLVFIMATALTLAGCGAQKTVENTAAGTETTVSEIAASETTAAEKTVEAALDANTETTTAASEATTKDTDAKEDKASADASKKSDAAAESSASSAVSETPAKKTTATTAEQTASTEQTPSAAQDVQAEQTPTTEQTSPAPQETPAAPEKVDYGRILFVGDSRTVDMFSADQDRINGEVHDGILVYAQDAVNYTFHLEVMSIVDTSNFDTLITWMGCNDYGNFGNYEPHYNGLLNEGKRIIVCTVGPTNDGALAERDKGIYDNAREIEFNAALVNWANQHGVKVIDLYSYLSSTGDVYINPEDGIHYMPQPTTVIWNVIRSALN